jgi:hypothetical protein
MTFQVFFQPFDLQRIQLHCGDRSYPAQPFDSNFGEKRAVEAFKMMFEGMKGGDNCGLTYDQFLDSCTFFVFDTSQDASGSAGRWGGVVGWDGVGYL